MKRMRRKFKQQQKKQVSELFEHPHVQYNTFVSKSVKNRSHSHKLGCCSCFRSRSNQSGRR